MKRWLFILMIPALATPAMGQFDIGEPFDTVGVLRVDHFAYTCYALDLPNDSSYEIAGNLEGFVEGDTIRVFGRLVDSNVVSVCMNAHYCCVSVDSARYDELPRQLLPFLNEYGLAALLVFLIVGGLFFGRERIKAGEIYLD